MGAGLRVVVREATNKDLEGIIEVLKSTKLSEKETWTRDAKWVKRTLKRFLKTENYKIFVAECNGEIVGFINYVIFLSFWECSKQGLINDFFVREDFQGKGIGSRLIEAVVAHADAEGIDEMHVSTGWENERARRLYGNFGFTEEHLLLERSRKK